MHGGKPREATMRKIDRKQSKQLRLNTETVRALHVLSNENLKDAVGGTDGSKMPRTTTGGCWVP
jgi:hypothetical protein